MVCGEVACRCSPHLFRSAWAAEDNVGDRLVTGDEGVDPDMGAAYADITREVLERVSVGV
jgi:hypothetical protein